MSESAFVRPANEYRHRAVAALAGGQVLQRPNGRAAVVNQLNAVAINDGVNLVDDGVRLVTKKSGEVWLDGAPIWWDHSANAATCVPPLVAGDKDFYLGTSDGDVATSTTSANVALNVEPRYIINYKQNGGDVAVVKTAGTPDIVQRGGSLDAFFSTTAEAQKLDWLSMRSFPLNSKWIIEGVVEIVTNGDANAPDLNIGAASDTHASNADTIAESAFFHFDPGNDLNIYAECDDGTNETAATDTTLDWAVGTPVHFAIDGRDPSSLKYYINGVRVLSGTTFNISAATGPLKALFHLEKTADDTPGRVMLHDLTVRLCAVE